MWSPQYSRGIGPSFPLTFVGPLCPALAWASRRTAAHTTARPSIRLPRTGMLDGGAEAGNHPLRRPLVDGSAGVEPQPPVNLDTVQYTIESVTEGSGVTLGHDEAVHVVSKKPAGSGTHAIAGDHGHRLVEGFVDDEAPGLFARRNRDRREHGHPGDGVVRRGRVRGNVPGEFHPAGKTQ